VLLMSMKSQVLRMIFRTPGRVDVEPPSVIDSLRKRATVSPRAWQAAVDVAVDDVEYEVVQVFSPSCPWSSCSLPLVVDSLVAADLSFFYFFLCHVKVFT
jgi:hypothetical protein